MLTQNQMQGERKRQTEGKGNFANQTGAKQMEQILTPCCEGSRGGTIGMKRAKTPKERNSNWKGWKSLDGMNSAIPVAVVVESTRLSTTRWFAGSIFKGHVKIPYPGGLWHPSYSKLSGMFSIEKFKL
jgi:hypothetical protein